MFCSTGKGQTGKGWHNKQVTKRLMQGVRGNLNNADEAHTDLDLDLLCLRDFLCER